MSDFSKHIIQYIDYGLKCLPVKEDKSPMIPKGWKNGFDPSYFKECFGVGIICGSQSGDLECLDFDNHFGDAKEVLSEFINIPEIKEIYDKYKFPIEKTMNGGYHLIYRCEYIEGNQKLARRAKFDKAINKWRPDAIIETRGENGYFAADPTPGYKFLRGDIKNIPVITKTERAVIINHCKSFNTWVEREHKSEHENKDKPGDIYNEKTEAINDAKNALLTAGWVEVTTGKWRRPGKKDGISATFGQVADNVFYNFSSSGYPFEPDSAYKPFQVVALLKHNGDFKAFASELAEKYSDIVKSRKPEKKKKAEPMEGAELDNALNKAFIDIDIPVSRPPIAMYIYENTPGYSDFDSHRLFTLGNFSAITGKGKSKKTFLTTLLLSAAATGKSIQDKFSGNLPANKKSVLLFDTEQSGYDAWVTAKRVIDLSGMALPHYGAFDLREYTPIQRCEIIEFALKKFGDIVGFVVIDGIADLAKAINDEEEASRVGSLLMRWTKQYNIHIVTVIHQNKGDNYATGHLGSMIIKKAEAVIGVERDRENKKRSIVTCDNMRGAPDFNTFAFDINDKGMPEIASNFNYIEYEKRNSGL